MAHVMELLEQGAKELGLELSGRQLDQFQVYWDQLDDWNRRVNLTAIKGCDQVQIRHFLDSLTLIPALQPGLGSAFSLADVGTGAGFPGLPLKLALPEIRLALIESVGKKARFLEHVVATLDLRGVEVHTGRAEELAHKPELREVFDLVVGRGVARFSPILEYTLPFCRVGGKAALQKRGAEAEIAGAGNALEVLGGRLGEVHPVKVAGLDDGRVVVSVDKVRSTPQGYPRRPGMPQKQPL